MQPFSRHLVALFGLALAWLGLANHAQATPQFYPNVDSIFEHPNDTSGQAGDLIAFGFHNFDSEATYYRVLFQTTARLVRYAGSDDVSKCTAHTWGYDSVSGHDLGTEYRCDTPIVSSGLVRVPHAGSGSAGYDTVAFTHGTLGSIPDCGPSRGFGPIWKSWMYGDGVVTVGADYPGLGYDSGLRSSDVDFSFWRFASRRYPFDETTHTYADGWSPAMSTVDLVRAAQQLVEEVTLGSHTNGRFIVTGSSQGGSTAISTGMVMAEGYAPDLELAGIIAGSPGSDLRSGVQVAQDKPIARGVIAAAIVGASITDSAIHPSEWMTETGMNNYDATTEQICSGKNDLASYLWWANMFLSYPLVEHAVDLAAGADFERFAKRQRLYGSPINAPIFIGHAYDDALNPYLRTALLYENMTQGEGNVQAPAITACFYHGNGDSSESFAGMENHTEVLYYMTEAQRADDCLSTGSGTAPRTVFQFLQTIGFEGLAP